MLITIDEKAVSWFAMEFDYTKPFHIRLYPQYAGFGKKHKGYSLAFSTESPTNPAFTKEVNGIIFYFEENDLWFFEDTETHLSFNPLQNELQVTYNETPNS
ncbi:MULTISPECIES: HesB/YadR/YfhF family protein [Neobacillus]|jgi:uncharacterized protein YneR|uniref:HesB/YadR/YfhF family protein n=1 Tax=Neobacillus sedimentimangrovi TaxID=2699460 RepID=A0ABS8QM58_9BACI|nr:hypothetical protein [Neobacillus sedimentimangrovi]AIM17333.1 hypothetical protein HW35_14745 [Bacillus sp. X1(2014)]MCD4840353.1 hypothetical protein [Neobacillus sedimentimangrovi]